MHAGKIENDNKAERTRDLFKKVKELTDSLMLKGVEFLTALVRM